MKLYTINATCEQHKYNKEDNLTNHQHYAETVSEILAEHKLDGFTIQEVQGYWQGVPEKSYTIILAVEQEDVIIAVCEMLRDTFQQDAVMLTNPDNMVRFI